jgi:hypothetical protein
VATDRRLSGEKENMASKIGPWFSNTQWGKRHAAVSVSLVVALLLFILWKSFL